jgi:two-component system NarL family response regulator
VTLSSPITVLIVEDHPVVRFGLVALIDSQPDMKVVCETGEGREAVLLYDRMQPSLAVVDLRLPDISGVDVILSIKRKHPEARVVVLTTYEGDEDIHRALAAGARGYVIKAMPHEVLLSSLRTVHAGGRSIPAPVATALAGRMSFAELTARETQILELISRGMSNKEIATTTGITEGTVKSHINVILGKLGATHRTEAAAIAIRRGIVHL